MKFKSYKMKRSILNLGKALLKSEQKNVNGGKLDGNPPEEPCVLNVVNYNSHGAPVGISPCNPRIHQNCCPDND